MRKAIVLLVVSLSLNCFAQNISKEDISHLFGSYSYNKVDTTYLEKYLSSPIWNFDNENRPRLKPSKNLLSRAKFEYEEIKSYLKVSRDEYLGLQSKRLNKKMGKKIDIELQKVSKYENRLNDSLLLFKKVEFDYIKQIRLNDSIKKSEERKSQLAIERKNIEQDSVLIQKQKNFLTPTYIYNTIGIGMPCSLQKNIERNLNLEFGTHRGGVDYYSINDIFVGMRFAGENRVLIELSFRLFGEEAAEYENKLMRSGFVLKSRKETSNLELEGDLSSQLLNGELRIYGKGEVVCEVIDGSYLGFSFYRTKMPTRKKK